MNKMELLSLIESLQYMKIIDFKYKMSEIVNSVYKCYTDLVTENISIVTKNSDGIYYLFYLDVVTNKTEVCLSGTIPDVFKSIQDRIKDKQSTILIDLEDEVVDFIYMLNKYGYDNVIQYKV